MKKKIVLLISILMLTLGIGVTASADDIYPNSFEENNYPFYNLTTLTYRYENVVVEYNVERSQVSNLLKIDGNLTMPLANDVSFPLEISYNYSDYNEYINLQSEYMFKVPEFMFSKISLTYENFVLKDYFLEDDIYSSLENTNIFLDSSSYFNIDSVDVVCYVLEYKFIDDEWQIVPVLYEFNVDTFVNQQTQQEGINFALIYDELQNYNSREEYAIRNMVVRFNISYNDVSSSNPYVITNMGYVPYDVPIANIYTTLNNQVWLEPIEYDYTQWIVNATKGFLDAEILPGFKISGILGICLTISLLMYILKLFLGG